MYAFDWLVYDTCDEMILLMCVDSVLVDCLCLDNMFYLFLGIIPAIHLRFLFFQFSSILVEIMATT